MTVPIVTEMTPAASEEISRPLPVRTQRRRRLWLATLVILLIAAVCWRVAAIDGWMRPVVVTGPSMAPTLWGPHFNPVCEACGITQRVVRPQAKDLDAWICSNCGHHQAFPKVKLRAGSSVWLDRGAYWFRSIQRDEMVALEQLEIGLRVKRVVGLPGETIGIKNGDLWVGAERYTKTLSQLRERAVLVHDDRFRAPDQTNRWQPFADAGWTPVATGYALEKPSESWQYLRYEHRSPYGVNRLWEVSRVLDDDHFNQHVRRRMFPCADLWLQVKLEAIAGPSFSGEVRMLLWTPDGVRSATFAVAELPAVLEIAWLDGKLWTRDADGDHDWGATDQTPEVPYQPDSQASETENTESDGEPLVTATHPLALAIRGSTPCRVTNLRVSRDLVLLGPPGHELDWTSEPIGEGEYFVLGDNVAVSIDGRTESQGVAAKQIVGKVEKN